MHGHIPETQPPAQSETRYPYCNAGQWAYEAIHSVGNVIFLGRRYVTRKVSWLKPENFDPATLAIPYRLDELTAAIAAGQTVIIAENEPTADLIHKLDFPATCFAASIWLPVYEQYFRNADVVIMARFWVERIGSGLAPAARKVRIVPPPETIGSADELARLVETATLYTAQPECFKLELGRPRIVNTRYGKRAVRHGPPTQAFKDAWKASNEGIVNYSFEEYHGRLQVSYWRDLPEEPQRSSAPDVVQAKAFLEKLRPGGPWVLIAIVPDGATTTITVNSFDQAETFIREHNGKRNLYYSVNPTRTTTDKKAAKTDIAAIEYLLADLDPAPGETAEAAKTRYLKRIDDGAFETTAGIDSGNGLQLLLRLRERIVLGEPAGGRFSPEDQAKIDDAEGRAAALMRRLGAKAGTQNIDRILRLPGTTNLPNAKKRRDGRTECPAKLLWFNDTSYPLAAFPPGEPGNDGQPNPPEPPGESSTVDWSKVSEPGWLKSVADLPDGAPLKLRIIADHTGNLEDLNFDLREKNLLTTDYHSWSDVTLALAAMLKLCNYTPEKIAEALLADLPCNRHIADQDDKRRAIERAISRSYTPDNPKPTLDDNNEIIIACIAEWNQQHAHVLAGGKSAVLREFTTAKGYIDFQLLPSAAFHEWNVEHEIEVGVDENGMRVMERATKIWMRHPKRRKYQDIGFFPGRNVPGHYNLWRGFAVEPCKGDCSRFLAHIYENACQGNKQLYEWDMAWFADIFQHPAVKCGTSLVFRGKQGTGKTKIGEVMESLLGVHYKKVAEPRFITGQFNSHMLSLLMLHADEGFWAGDKKAEGKLKDLVTGNDHPIEFKGKEAFWIYNFLRLLVTGNPNWQVPAAFEERRFAVQDMSDAHRNDYPYFAAIDAEMNAGGREALLYHLLFEVDCQAVNLRQIPHTAALLEQKLETASPEQGWWLDTLNRGVLPGNRNELAHNWAAAEALYDDYIEHARKQGVSGCDSK
jgi:hypothetical protein